MSSLEGTVINLIITGVGGQGNILISKIMGQVFMEEGRTITIGETYGATQRGGSVASHVRISTERIPYSPVTPKGKADIILGLEPSESLRILTAFGYPGTFVVTNTRPVHSLEVAIGETAYPSGEILCECMNELSKKAWFLDASEHALSFGKPPSNQHRDDRGPSWNGFASSGASQDGTAVEEELRGREAFGKPGGLRARLHSS
jgi:indolepyruvate ferredoxin oxidoreductase, beta subunit